MDVAAAVHEREAERPDDVERDLALRVEVRLLVVLADELVKVDGLEEGISKMSILPQILQGSGKFPFPGLFLHAAYPICVLNIRNWYILATWELQFSRALYKLFYMVLQELRSVHPKTV